MRTWQSTDRWQLYVTVPELEAWRGAQADKIAARHDTTADVMAESRSLSDAEAHSDSVRRFRQIIANKRASLDARTDRQLAKRSDALGQLSARAPKRERKAAA